MTDTVCLYVFTFCTPARAGPTRVLFAPEIKVFVYMSPARMVDIVDTLIMHFGPIVVT